MATVHSREMLQQAGHIWKMLDELAATDPEAYRKFVQKNMTEGKKGLAKPEPFMCIKTKILMDKTDDVILYVNICKWTRVPGPKNSTDAVPITGGPLEQNTGPYKVTRVALNPVVLSECSSKKAQMELLLKLIIDFVENQHSLYISRKYTIMKEKYTGDQAELNNFFGQKSILERQVFESMDELKALSPETLLAKMGQMSVEDDKISELSLHGTDVNQATQKDKVLIEEIKRKEGDLPRPNYELSVKEKDNRKERRVVLRVKLLGVSSVTECDLQINKGEVILHVRDKYHLEVKVPEPFQEEAVSAKFIRKSCTLSVTLPIEDR